MKYILGLDVGIGSVGWAVIRNEEKIKRIEDFGVRIFDSGEAAKGQKRHSEERREFRSARRVLRRRQHRKWRIKAHFENIGLTSVKAINEYYETASPDIISLRVKAIDEKISPEELAACLVHICGHRGYRDFYEYDPDSMTEQEKKDYEEAHKGSGILEAIFVKGKYRTAAEMIKNDPYFNVEGSEYRRYRNSQFYDEKIMFTREMLKTEVAVILEKQKEFYPQLTQNNIDVINNIIFAQRDFEDGPGNKEDVYRRYTGFLDSIGKCTFYKEEDRGSRFTLLSDAYALVNVLSQFVYVNEKTGEIGLPVALAEKLVCGALQSGKINFTEVKKTAKAYDILLNCADKSEFDKCLKFTKSMRQTFIDAGYDWEELVIDYADEASLLNRVGIFLSQNITPERRRKNIKKDFPEFADALVEKLIAKKASGTASVCYRFMRESIEAFLRGESYGSFQAIINKQQKASDTGRKYYKLPAFDKDCEFYNSPVVMRSINETRKIINAVIEKYGSPFAINIEVATELNKSFENRNKDAKNNKKNEKANDAARAAVAEILGLKAPSDVTPAQLERYKLGEKQHWRCLYSGREIKDKREAIENKKHTFEVDHIIPFSLILDDTLNNKALVFYSENQAKGQRTPLMYMEGEKAKEFKKNVNAWFRGKEDKRKYRYLMTESFDDELLSEWKSRNINDTRYISKFLVNYLRGNLVFARGENDEKFVRTEVYGVKSAITSHMRRQWLNADTWGVKNKAELKERTYLDHAVDAIVIANCIPAYVEMAALNLRLRDIYYAAGKVETEEYRKVLEKAKDNLFKFFGILPQRAEVELTRKKNTPSLIPNLRDEVELRLCDCDMERYFDKRAAEKEGTEYKERRDEEIKKNFFDKVKDFYRYDPDFAAGVHMPLVSVKPDKKINKGLFDEQPLSIKNIDGVDYLIKSVTIKSLKKKDIPFIYTNDNKLIRTLETFFEGYDDTVIGEKVMKDKGISEFIYNGRRVNKVKVKNEYLKRYYVKEISESNHTVLKSKHYYCAEIYKDAIGNTNLNAISYADLVKVGDKLYLRPDYQYPENYSVFVTYIYPNDFIKVTNEKGEIKEGEIKEGYYMGIEYVIRNQINITENNSQKRQTVSIKRSDEVKKINIDILGNKGGEIKCGEPLSLIAGKD